MPKIWIGFVREAQMMEPEPAAGAPPSGRAAPELVASEGGAFISPSKHEHQPELSHQVDFYIACVVDSFVRK